MVTIADRLLQMKEVTMSLFVMFLVCLGIILLFGAVYLGGKYYERSLRENLLYPKSKQERDVIRSK